MQHTRTTQAPVQVALFLFNSSLYAMQPWLDAGIACVAVDYHDTDHSAHRTTQAPVQGLTRINLDLSTDDAPVRLRAILDAMDMAPALCISFTPCTDLAVSGAAHFQKKRERDPEFQNKALQMALVATYMGCPYIVENPVSVLSTIWRKPDTTVHPYQCGGWLPPDDAHPEAPQLFPPQDAYPKKTCLWLGKGARGPVLNPVPVAVGDFVGHTMLGGKSARTKHLRSLTPRGVAMGLYLANKELFS